MNKNKTIPFTAHAYAEKQQRLAKLIQRRKEVMESLIEARQAGDLSENSAYSAAKFELGNIGRQMRYLRTVLSQGYVAAIDHSKKMIGFGSTVTLENENKKFTFMLVSEHEADMKEGKISLQSPIGQAVVGKKVSDKVEVVTPRGNVTYKIVAIK